MHSESTSPGFEGPEKLLEIWFAPGSDVTDSTTADSDTAKRGLMQIARHQWESMLKLVKCEVLNVITSPNMDAYLLSESSMFVTENELILKTCGTTTLLCCVEYLLRLAASVGLTQVDYVFYSRKSFMFPDRQCFPHTDWSTEVQWLERYFENGSAYVVGKLNSDHWYCYVQHRDSVTRQIDTDQTLEILMTGLDPDAASVFYPDNAYDDGTVMPYDVPFDCDQDPDTSMDGHDSDSGQGSSGCSSKSPESDVDEDCDTSFENALVVSATAQAQLIGKSTAPAATEGSVPARRLRLTKYLQEMYPHANIDDHQFEPCGYSCNGLTPRGYFTVHVTPEQHCSYASFETNIPPVDENGYPVSYTEIVDRVIRFFRPKRFTLSLFTDHQNVSFKGSRHMTQIDPRAMPIVDRHQVMERAMNLSLGSSRQLKPILQQQQSLPFGGRVKGYKRQDKIIYEFSHYDLLYYHYTREGYT